jgi:hypothetical protein
MKDKLFKDRLVIQNDIDKQRAKIKQIEAYLHLSESKAKILDQRIAQELQNNLTSEYTLDGNKYILQRDLTTAILKEKRTDALKYNNKLRIGIFALRIDGMRLKKWVKDILSQNMAVPDFVSYEEYPRIRIEKIL